MKKPRPTPPSGLYSLLRAAHVAQEHIDAELGSLGLSIPKLAALKVLKDVGESLPLGQLADRLACVKSNITQLVDRLEADGLVRRTQDRTDRRSRLAVLTAEGRKACDAGMRLQQRTAKELLGGLTPDEAAALTNLVSKVTERVG